MFRSKKTKAKTKFDFLITSFSDMHKFLGLIEIDRFYKEGISEIIIIQSHKDKVGAKKLARKMLEQGGKIIDNKFILLLFKNKKTFLTLNS